MHQTSLLTSVLHFGSVIFLTVGALLPIVDPLGNAPIYISMTAGLTPEQRRRMAKAVAINSFLLLLASTLVGAYVLDFFGLSIPAVQVAGGIVVFAMGWQLLNQPDAIPSLERTDASGYTTEYLQRTGLLSDDHAAYRGPWLDLGGTDAGRQSAGRFPPVARHDAGAYCRHPHRCRADFFVRPLRAANIA